MRDEMRRIHQLDALTEPRQLTMNIVQDIQELDKQIAANQSLIARAHEENEQLQSKRDRFVAILTPEEKAELNPPAETPAPIGAE